MSAGSSPAIAAAIRLGDRRQPRREASRGRPQEQRVADALDHRRRSVMTSGPAMSSDSRPVDDAGRPRRDEVRHARRARRSAPCGARASRAAAAPARARRAARGSGTSASARRSRSRRAARRPPARRRAAAPRPRARLARWRDAARLARHQPAEVDDPPHARRARRRRRSCAAARRSRSGKSPPRAPPSAPLHRVDEVVRDVDARRAPRRARRRSTASPRTTSSAPGRHAAPGRARIRARVAGAGEAGTSSAPIAPVDAGDENVHLRRTAVRIGEHPKRTEGAAVSLTGCPKHVDLLRFSTDEENLRHLRVCRCRPSQRVVGCRRSGERGCRRGGRDARWRRSGLPRRRCRARTATSSATSSARSISKSRARRSAPTIPMACARRGSSLHVPPGAAYAGRVGVPLGAGAGRAAPLSARGAMTWAAPDLRGRVAVVTGASRGVGRGIALALGDCGAIVYVTGRSSRARSRARGTVERPPPTRDDPRRPRDPRAGDHTDDARRGGVRPGRTGTTAASTSSSPTRGAATRPAPASPPRSGSSRSSAGTRCSLPVCARSTHRPRRAPAMVARARADRRHGRHRPRDHYLGNVPYDVVRRPRTGSSSPSRTSCDRTGSPRSASTPASPARRRWSTAFAQHGAEPPAETHSPEFVGRAVAPSSPATRPMRLSGTGAQAATSPAATASPTSTGGPSRPSRSPTTLGSRLRLRRPRDGPSTRLPGVSVSPCARIEQNTTSAARSKIRSRAGNASSRARAARTSSSRRPWARTRP